jgi:hypothetical protein
VRGGGFVLVELLPSKFLLITKKKASFSRDQKDSCSENTG